ncbi:hypothetical protein LSAT2_014550, partial [Lamellibrachia satsuma]
QYDLYEECQSYWELKRKRTVQKPFRAGRRSDNVPSLCFAFNKGNCSRPNCRYSHSCSKCKRLGHGFSNCSVHSKEPFSATSANEGWICRYASNVSCYSYTCQTQGPVMSVRRL